MFLGFLFALALFVLLVFSVEYFRSSKDFGPAVSDTGNDAQNLERISSSTILKKAGIVRSPDFTLLVRWCLPLLYRELSVSSGAGEERNSFKLHKRVSILMLLLGSTVSYYCTPLGLILIFYSILTPRFSLTLSPEGFRVETMQKGWAGSGSEDFAEKLNKACPWPTGVSGSLETLKTALQLERTALKEVWITFLLVLFLAVAQRILEGQVKLQGYVFFPLYLALPLVAGRLRGAWPGALVGSTTFLALLTAAYPFPSSGLLSGFPSAPGSLFASFIMSKQGSITAFSSLTAQYAIIALCLSAAGLLTGLLSRNSLGNYVFFAPALLLVAPVYLFEREALYGPDIFAQTALAAALAIVTILFTENSTAERSISSTTDLRGKASRQEHVSAGQ